MNLGEKKDCSLLNRKVYDLSRWICDDAKKLSVVFFSVIFSNTNWPSHSARTRFRTFRNVTKIHKNPLEDACAQRTSELSTYFFFSTQNTPKILIVSIVRVIEISAKKHFVMDLLFFFLFFRNDKNIYYETLGRSWNMYRVIAFFFVLWMVLYM